MAGAYEPPKGWSNCVERHLIVATLPLYGPILKWAVSVVSITKALRWTSCVGAIPQACNDGENSNELHVVLSS